MKNKLEHSNNNPEDINWVALRGQVNYQNNILTLILPNKITSSNDVLPVKGENFFAAAKNSKNFSEGQVVFNACIENKDCVLRLVFGSIQGKQVTVSLGTQSKGVSYWIGYSLDGVNFSNLGGTGASGGLEEREYQFKALIRGSTIHLCIDNVEVLKCVSPIPIPAGQLTIILNGQESINLKNWRQTIEDKTAFVVMQFTSEFQSLHETVIKPVCEEFGYTGFNVGEKFTQNLLIKDIEDSIRNASLVIADISPDNPNVFYEVGFAHAIQKPTILLCDRKIHQKRANSKLPFDVAGFRVIFYDNTISGKGNVEEQLRRHLQSIVENA